MDYPSSVNLLQAAGLAIDGAGAVFLMRGAMSATPMDVLRSQIELFPNEQSQMAAISSIVDLKIGGITLVFGFFVQAVGQFILFNSELFDSIIVVLIALFATVGSCFLVRRVLIKRYWTETEKYRQS